MAWFWFWYGHQKTQRRQQGIVIGTAIGAIGVHDLQLALAMVTVIAGAR
jgi:hypothetical protein